MSATRPRHRSALALLAVLAISLFAAACKCPVETAKKELPAQDAKTAEAEAAQQQAFADFRKKREDRLRQPGSWLTLVGLYWLHDGDNSAGSAPTSEIVFPPSLPASFGTFVVPGKDGAAAELHTSGGFTVDVQQGEGEKQTGQSVVPLFPDTSDKTTRVESGSVSFFAIDRQGKLGIRIKDSESETFKNFQGIETYPPTWEWRKRVRFIPAPPGKKIKVPNVLGQVAEEDSAGTIVFEHGGKIWQMEALPDEGEDGITFVFGDGTNGKAGGSYGGGRFLDAKVEGGNRKTATSAIVDFNLAYNPPCVFTPFATCPLPPAESKIELPIEAGEKVWGHH